MHVLAECVYEFVFVCGIAAGHFAYKMHKIQHITIHTETFIQ